MSRVQPLTRVISGTIGGGSAGTISIGPNIVNEVWFPVSVSISCTGNQPTPTAPNIATCNIYAGIGVSNSTLVDGTYQVLAASSSMISGQTIYTGQQVFAVWANCNPGQTITMVIQGTRRVP